MSGQTAFATVVTVATFIATGGNLAATKMAWIISPAVGGLYFPPGDTMHAQPNELDNSEEVSHVAA